MFSVIGVDRNGNVLPLYFSTNEESAQNEFDSISKQKIKRNLLHVVLLKETKSA